MAAKKTAAKAPSRAGAREEEAAELNHKLLSEKVRGATLANDRSEAEMNRDHSKQAEGHFDRRREAGTSEAESKAAGARQRVAHEHDMNRHAVHAATSAHHQQVAVNAHQKRMHQHLEEAAQLKNQHATNAERRAEESHQQNMAVKAQQAHAAHRAHRRGALAAGAAALFGASGGGAAKSAMHGQVGGRP